LEITLYNEFKRKAIHLFALSIPIGYYFLPKKLSLALLLPFALGSIIFDVVRLHSLPGAKFLNSFFGPILREHESKDLTGSSYILSGAAITIALFSKKVAVTAICFIILGDIAAALIGRPYGKTKIIGTKSLEGSGAFLILCLLVGLGIPGLPFWIGIIGAIVAMLMELAPLPIDDNISVPLISGAVMELLLLI